MAISRFDRRIRIVSFRLSEREYTALREFCAAHGLHGISDLTRRAIRGWFTESAGPDQSKMPSGVVEGNGLEPRSAAHPAKFSGRPH